MQYRKKPVVIEAVQFTDESFEDCVRFLGSSARLDVHARAIIIPTLEGDMKASIGDFIIRGTKGEFYPRKPDIFAQTYGPADEPFTPTPPDNGKGVLEIGVNDVGEVVMNLPRDMTGHIVFSPSEAMKLAEIFRRRAHEAADNPTRWNPWNKVVQDHRDGTINHELTNRQREKYGLPVPWTPEMADTEKDMPGVP